MDVWRAQNLDVICIYHKSKTSIQFCMKTSAQSTILKAIDEKLTIRLNV